MTAKVFVDSNVLIYAHDADAGVRHEKSSARLTELWASGGGRLSTQVLQEFYVNVTQKIQTPIPKVAARELIRTYKSWVHSSITPETILRASEIGGTWKISFWDSLIVASAEQDGAPELLTEDLNHGQVIAGVRVVDPFR